MHLSIASPAFGLSSTVNSSTRTAVRATRGSFAQPFFRASAEKGVHCRLSMSTFLKSIGIKRAELPLSPAEALSKRPRSTISASAGAGDAGEIPFSKVGSTTRVQGLVLTSHVFQVPLDHSGEESGTVDVFVREVAAASKANDTSLPYLIYLQGGPGFESPRPMDAGGWIGAAVERFRVLLLDQRGTGSSTPVTARSLTQKGDARTQAEYLKFFRADSIVQDAEMIRRALLPDGAKWTTLGQSFGGFCTLSYLSMFPEALERSLITGGLAPTSEGCSADEVYTALFKRVRAQNAKYYQRFPQDVRAVQVIVQHLQSQAGGGVALPDGGILTAQGLQLLGINFGQAGGMERVHYLMESAWDGTGELSLAFLKGYTGMLAYDTNPIYALLHESIYCNGQAEHADPSKRASNWAAERVRRNQGSHFDASRAVEDDRPVPFTGEMVFPFMFDEMAALRPLKEVAHLLAAKEDWPALYRSEALTKNTVPVAAAAYYEDMYVEMALSQATADQVQGTRMWVTSEYMHSGVREDGPKIFNRLVALADDEIPIR
ncbi:hypothetical protein CYMTET_25073 [Cymbomonas tetramitiformis]|uniref:AB hydrolase-1 domain-containing protein n=1 Tax=Cymbomonas tetramitiformis TaxID=36881 RepID=A0AAE0FUL2_9CHLO|nr:hypothetical protein CYMTET_25073 [Cymbomonas tetramitiformis]